MPHARSTTRRQLARMLWAGSAAGCVLVGLVFAASMVLFARVSLGRGYFLFVCRGGIGVHYMTPTHWIAQIVASDTIAKPLRAAAEGPYAWGFQYRSFLLPASPG